MSFQYSTYSETSGSTSVASSNSAYGTWGQLSVSCYTSGSTLYYTLTAHTSDYPFLRAVFWVSGIGNVYDSGYVKTNSKAFPRGNGTTYSSSVNLGSSSSNPTVAVGIGVSTSSITWGPNATFYRTKYNWYWNDINAWNPKQDSQYGAKFDVYYSYQNATYNNQTNEPGPLYGPLNSWMRIFNVRPLDNTQEVYNITGYDGRDFNYSSDSKDGLPCYTDEWGYDSWWQYNDDGDGAINIYTRYKITTLTFDLNNGSWKPNSGITSNKRQMQYNSTTSNAPIPIRTGYKFLGWYTTKDGGTQVFKADGTYNSNATSYWNSGGGYKGTNDLILYANWKIQNVAYVKTDAGWKLATIYVKTEKGWEPAILYVKTENGWKQSVV